MAARKVDDQVKPYLSLLGKVPDQDIAAKAGVSRSVIVNYRKRLNIPAYEGYKFGIRPGTPGAPASNAGKAGKGRAPAPKPAAAKPAAAKPAPAAKPAAAKPAPAPAAKPAPVPAPAAKLDGRTRAARLAKAEAEAATMPPAAKAAPAGSFRGRRSALDPYLDMLGTVADVEIARLAGVTSENVRTYRMRRGIAAPATPASAAPVAAAPAPAARAPAPPPKAAPPVVKPAPVAQPAPAPKAAPAPAPRLSGRVAFVVQVDTAQGPKSYALVANDIAEAARLAVEGISGRHKDAAIRSVQKVAELL